MRDITSALYGLESPSMISRDPDGVDSREIHTMRLEPVGSRSEAIIPGPTDSDFSGITEDTEVTIPVPPRKAFDVASLIGVPPPPPKAPPPRKKGSKKKEKRVNTKQTDFDQANDENVGVINVTTPVYVSGTKSPLSQKLGTMDEDDEDDDDDLFSFITTESNTIDVDDYSLASRSVMSVQSNKPDISAPSPASAVTALQSNTTKEGVMSEEDKKFFATDQEAQKPSRDKKKGFLRKLFRGRGKNKADVGQMDVIAESISLDSIPAADTEHEKPTDMTAPTTTQAMAKDISENIQVERHKLVDLDDHTIAEQDGADATALKLSTTNQSFAQDPPDDEHGDPPQHSGPPLISPRSAKKTLQTIDVAGEETGRSRIAHFYGPADDSDYLVQSIPSTLSIDKSLYGGDISITQRLSVDPEADGENPKIMSTKARDAQEFKVEAYKAGRQPTPTSAEQLLVLVATESVDPVGASPKLDGDTRGRAEVEIVFKEPAGASPLAWKVAHDDPLGASPCHAEELKKLEPKDSFTVARTKSEDPPLVAEDIKVSRTKREDSPLVAETTNETDKETAEEPIETVPTEEPTQEVAKDTVEEAVKEIVEAKKDTSITSKPPMSPAVLTIATKTETNETSQNTIGIGFDAAQKEARPEASRAALDLQELSVANVSELNPVEATLEIQSGDKTAAKTMWVSAAAFSSAETLAYLHELQGQPSPRHSWHVSKRKDDDFPPSPMHTEKKTPKEVLKAKLREKYSLVQESDRMKTPSPDEYTAENFDETIERANKLERKDISKFQGFGYQSRFKGRKPTRKDKQVDSLSIAEAKTTRNEKPRQSSFSSYASDENKYTFQVTPGKIAAQAVARNRATRKNAHSEPENQSCKKQRREGKNRFRFRVPESEIKDPIQRASRRLLTKAALRIQTAARMYLAKREAVDRMWALLAIQSYARRWKCEAILREHANAIKSVQSIARAWIVKKEIARRNAAAVKLQKTVRGYLAAAEVYDMMYCLASIQALMRGAYVRHIKAKRKALLAANAHKAIPMQSMIRAFIARKELAGRHATASKMQSIWRAYVAKVDFQMQIVDIIVMQSVVRRWLACRQVHAIRNIPYFAPASKIQAMVRGRLGRSYHKKMLAAQQIQRVWRGFQAYTDYVFALVDIIVVQRKVRQWLAVRKCNTLREEKSSKLENAATKIQKTWRGFWCFSQYIIVQYEVTRLQAIVRGKLARENYQFKLGCAIIIQAKVRQHLARKKLTSEKIDKTMVLAKAEELREKNSAKRIQFWWRIVIEWTKEKKAALVIERFFINVKKEVEREVHNRRRRSSTQRKNRKRRESQPLPGHHPMVAYDNQMIHRSQSAPRARKPPTHRTPTNAGRSRRMPSPSPRHLNKEHQNWPVDSVLQLSESNVSEVSNITTPETLLRSSTSFDRRQKGNRTATNYIQKYNKAEMYSTDNRQDRAPQKRSESPAAPPVDQQSQHFFSDGRGTPSRKEGVPPRTDRKAAAAMGQQGRRRSTSATSRGHRMPPSPHRKPPSPHRMSSSPRRMAPSPHQRSPSHHRMHPSPRRTQPSPHRVSSSPRRATLSPRRERLSNLPPVDLSKHGAIKRDETVETDSMSHSSASRSVYDNRRNPAEERGYSSRREFRDQPISLLGPDYGEV
ncbi:MAG: hypothetical protein SGBAC_000634 [Bacillariaceae sp.]